MARARAAVEPNVGYATSPALTRTNAGSRQTPTRRAWTTETRTGVTSGYTSAPTTERGSAPVRKIERERLCPVRLMARLSLSRGTMILALRPLSAAPIRRQDFQPAAWESQENGRHPSLAFGRRLVRHLQLRCSLSMCVCSSTDKQCLCGHACLTCPRGVLR